MELVEEFYYKCLEEAYKQTKIPSKIQSVLCDTRWTDEFIIENLKNNDDDPFYDADYFYKKLFLNLSDNIDKMTLITSSSDIGEDENVYGDYEYYIGYINLEVSYIFQYPSHPYVYPYRIIMYGPMFQFIIQSDQIDIEVYRVVLDTRKKFFIPEPERSRAIKDEIINTDRPILFNHKE